MALCKLLEGPSFRAELFNMEDGISFFLNLMSGTDPIQKELATNTLLQFKYNQNSLRVSILYYSNVFNSDYKFLNICRC